MTIDEIKAQLAAMVIALAELGYEHAAHSAGDAITFIEAADQRKADEAQAAGA